MVHHIAFSLGQLEQNLGEIGAHLVAGVHAQQATAGFQVSLDDAFFLCEISPFFGGFDVRWVDLHGSLVAANGFLGHVRSLLNRTQIKPTGRMPGFQILSVGHGCNCMVVKVEPGHGPTCDSPGAGMLGADGFEMWFQESQRSFGISILDQTRRFLNERIDVNRLHFRFRHLRDLGLGFADDFLLGNDNLGSTLELVNAERGVLIVVVMDGFLQKIFRVFDACFLSNLFDNLHVDRLRNFNRWLHGLHGHRYAAVFAPFFELDQRRMAGKESERLLSHGVGALKVADSFQQDGEVGGGGCVLVVQVKADLKRLACTACVLLRFEKNASIEPRHVAGRVQGDGFVERSQSSFHVVSSTSLLAHGEQHFDHFLGVLNFLKFGNNVSGCFDDFVCRVRNGLNDFVFNRLDRLVDRGQCHVLKAVVVDGRVGVVVVVFAQDTSPCQKRMTSHA